jgi:hypothetical protein
MKPLWTKEPAIIDLVRVVGDLADQISRLDHRLTMLERSQRPRPRPKVKTHGH